MKDSMTRKVILLSTNLELYDSFQQAFYSLAGIETIFNKYELPLSGNDVFLIDAIINEENNEVVADLRLSDILCPVIVLTFASGRDFYSDTALWRINPSVNIDDLLDLIKYSEPIPKKESILTLICWLSKASHDLRGMLYSRKGVEKAIGMAANVLQAFSDKISRSTEEEMLNIMSMLASGVYDADSLSKSIMLLFSDLYETVK